jgi:predicted ATPase/DNA-binding SARP family transcriptional activator
MDSRWTIEMFGWMRVVRGSVEHRSLSQKAASLLAYLALRADTAHSREELATLLWPEATPDAGRHSLRTRLYELRGILEPTGIAGAPRGSVLEAGRESVRLVPGSFTTDVAEFKRDAAASAIVPDPERVEALERALGWYRGELLAGFYDGWIVAERRRLAALYADLLARLLDALAAHHTSGRATTAIDVAHRLIACDPLNEDAHMCLVRLYAEDGRVGTALDQYRAFVAVLRDDLGVEPSPEAQQIARELLERSKAAQFAQAKPSAPARESRESRNRATAKPASLPVSLTRFVGREDELARLGELLRPGASRVVTVVGPGGIGKTRLATEFARGLQATLGARVVFAELADIVDPSFVSDAIVSAAALRAGPGDDVLDSVADALTGSAGSAGQPPALLVIDNAETATDGVADVVRALVDRGAPIRVLVTSREPLGVTGEIELRLGPLPTPVDWELPSDLERNPSVQMYVDRVRARRADFRLTSSNAAAVARLCTKLEGIPLALELAAVRERVLPAAQLIARMERRFDLLVSAQRDVPERHRTLSAAIGWSFSMLTPEARRIASRLAVFRGGWSLEEAEGIFPSPETADVVERLCDVSLVEAYERAGARRFRMLETVREYALGQVPADERDDLYRLHARLILALAERAQVYLSEPAWFERIDAEFENVRAALDYSLRAGDVVTVVRVLVSLSRHWRARSRQREARRWLGEAIERGADRLPRRLLGRAMRQAADLAFDDGDLAEAGHYFEQARALFDEVEDPVAAALIVSGLGAIAARHDDFEEARRQLGRALEIAVSSEHVELRGNIANDLGVLEARTGNFDAALEHFATSLSMFGSLGDEANVLVVHYNVGYLLMIVGRFDEAEASLDESLAISRRIGHTAGIASASTFRGLLELKRGNTELAIALCRAAADLCLEAGDRHRLVLAIEGLGVALAAAGRDEDALRALGHAAALREATETEALLEDPELRERTVASLASRVGADRADALLAEGRATPSEAFV